MVFEVGKVDCGLVDRGLVGCAGKVFATGIWGVNWFVVVVAWDEVFLL